jgi:hypothetical protein
MDKKLKDGLLIILVVIILALVGYIALRPSNVPAPQAPQTDSQVTLTDNDQTATCAAQAETVLRDEKAHSEDNALTQRNHYNKSLSKCLVEISDMETTDGQFLSTYYVEDAYEQKVLISCAQTGSTPEFCFIPTVSSPTNQVIHLTAEEGDARIRDYLNN